MLALGYRKQDMFTDRLTTPAVIALVFGSHPGTSVYHAISEGWSTESHLLANISEQHARLINPPERYRRPGLKNETEIPAAPGGFGVMSIAEFEAQRAQRWEQ